MRRYLLALLALCLCLTGCMPGGGAPAESSQSPETTEAAAPEPVPLLEEHYVILVDIAQGRVLLTNLDQEDPLAPENVAWVWQPTAALGWEITPERMKKASVDEAKVRWSEYFQTYVLLVICAGNWVGIAEYPSGKCLWERSVPYGPHSIEMLPNGDVVVASSGVGDWDNGRIMYFDVTAGENCRMTDEVMLPGAHGVTWDAVGEFLWAWGYPSLDAYQIVQTETGPKFQKLEGEGALSPSYSGHDLTQDAIDPDKLWVSVNSTILQYSKAKKDFSRSFPYSDYLYAQQQTKSVGNFPDGVIVLCAYGKQSDHPDSFTAIYPNGDGTYEVKTFRATDGSGWTKVRPFSPDYGGKING